MTWLVFPLPRPRSPAPHAGGGIDLRAGSVALGAHAKVAGALLTSEAPYYFSPIAEFVEHISNMCYIVSYSRFVAH